MNGVPGWMNSYKITDYLSSPLEKHRFGEDKKTKQQGEKMMKVSMKSILRIVTGLSILFAFAVYNHSSLGQNKEHSLRLTDSKAASGRGVVIYMRIFSDRTVCKK